MRTRLLAVTGVLFLALTMPVVAGPASPRELASASVAAEGAPAAPTAAAARACGSFRMSGLLTAIRVKVTRGGVPCGRARQVMKSLFNRKRSRVFGWSCLGPQTGYAACRKRGNRVVATF